MKHSNLYFGLVLPSGGWQSLIVVASDMFLIIDEEFVLFKKDSSNIN